MTDVIQAVIFDLDDTLVVEEPSAVAAFMEVCRQAEQICGVEADRLYTAVWETARSIWRQSPRIKPKTTLAIELQYGDW